MSTCGERRETLKSGKSNGLALGPGIPCRMDRHRLARHKLQLPEAAQSRQPVLIRDQGQFDHFAQPILSWRCVESDTQSLAE